MSFKYALTANQQTPTSDSKVILCKSFKIDIAAGSGFTTATSYTLGMLPKDAQVVAVTAPIATAVSGGTVSAATLGIQVGGVTVVSGLNVYAAGSGAMNVGNYYATGLSPSIDPTVVYIPTLTGAGATAGVIYINILYVV